MESDAFAVGALRKSASLARTEFFVQRKRNESARTAGVKVNKPYRILTLCFARRECIELDRKLSRSRRLELAESKSGVESRWWMNLEATC